MTSLEIGYYTAERRRCHQIEKLCLTLSRNSGAADQSSAKGAAMLRQAALQGLARARGGTLQRAIQTSTASCQDKVAPEGLQPVRTCAFTHTSL
jgi:hypothetical protein